MANVPIYHVDAFADRPFAGNPAAICLLDQEFDARWLQSVAAEMNLSETAFVRPLQEGFELRWFTPAVEVDLCGHATLAAAHVLWQEQVVDSSQIIQFHTRSGVLPTSRQGDFIELDFPAIPVEGPLASPPLVEALGITPSLIARTKFDVLVELASAAQVRSLKPDLRRLREVPARGVMVTSRSDDPRYDFVSRFFAPAVGIDEDPVCGSAHCVLGPFWRQRLGKSELTGYQASARGGVVRVRVVGDRVVLGGTAVTVLKGTLL